ncbi:MAG: GGDEF domain-containing protein, partial [Bacillota bacterium]
KLPISIVIADLDELKQINDTYGHKVGDQYITYSAEILDAVTREEDITARVGGDEFSVILPETDLTAAESLAKRVQNRVAEINNEIDLPESLSISLGFAVKDSQSQSLEDVFEVADKNMYQSKR